LGLDEFGLEVLDIRLIQGKLPLEGTIRHAPLALEQSDYLGQHIVKVHARRFPYLSGSDRPHRRDTP
jgi:hypothetical protein